MPLSDFHPAIAEWFTTRLGVPTAAQTSGWESIREQHHTLISAPTGSGKTLAAFLVEIDELLKRGLEGSLADEIQVVYVSPLKALGADIHRNLEIPLREVDEILASRALPAAGITAAVRSGDTPASVRQAMLRRPPHILVTTPESLYLLLTARRSRELLRSVRTVIVDEIHAVLESRRGAHLALSLERLAHVTDHPLQRIGLSATQKPIEQVARFLVGGRHVDPDGRARCSIVDTGHQRELDLALELPSSALDAVLGDEVWTEIYERLVSLIEAHDTTLIFVNTRRLAERVAHQLSGRLGEEAVTAHHGSLAKEARLSAEQRLKAGSLKALVATASLELGIDIGSVDLVCQLGSPRRIATLLQRVGRSGHTVHGTPKGRLFPMTRDDLVECTALLRCVQAGELDRIIMPEKPLDVLSQQIAAETASEEWQEDELWELVRCAYPYRELSREDYGTVIRMLADGFTTKRGRRGALLHHDQVNHRVRGRRGARMTAITAGGAIPDLADYRVVMDPTETFVGTLSEDFAIESSIGDIFQLGNTSWRILRVEQGTVRVADAHGQPPTIPFWFGEAPARSPELSKAVSDLRVEVAARLDNRDVAQRWLEESIGIGTTAALQIVEYLAETRRMLGVVPSQQTVVLERFFDESGGMQLVLHAPFGARVNRGWGLALRKRFCRSFNFELQAAATDEGLILSLGQQHSFPIDDVFRYLHPDTVRDLLIQALLDAPMFETRWRWNVTISLAVPRQRGGRRIPPQVQRMQAEDFLAAVFPDATACLENIAGDREVPDHPLVSQAVQDCLVEAMDIEHLTRLVAALHGGELKSVGRDTPEPSPLAHEIINARPYAFLDPAPLEERRTQAVQTRRAFAPSHAAELGALDPAAIQLVRDQVWPDPRDPDEMHELLLTAAFITSSESERDESWRDLLSQLQASGRAFTVSTGDGQSRWVATERLAEILAALPTAEVRPEPDPRSSWLDREVRRDEALRDIIRGRLEILGPTTVSEVAASLGIRETEAESGLVALETQGIVLRGHFTPEHETLEWCDRALLARIHRATLNKLRAEIQPVSQQEFMRFLFSWQRVEPESRAAGRGGLESVIEILDGYECPAGAWEAEVLPMRLEDYDPRDLDALCLSGRVAWGRLSAPGTGNGGGQSVGPIKSTPTGLFLRGHTSLWLGARGITQARPSSPDAGRVIETLEERGASFFGELVAASGLLPTQVERALAELAALGLVTCDSFEGLRALLLPSDKRRPFGVHPRRHRGPNFSIETAGRWSRPAPVAPLDDPTGTHDVEEHARVLLRRYGVVFRKLLERESNLPPWRDLNYAYRRLEAQGEIRGGRFVSGFTGEQYALPEAVTKLRKIRKEPPTERTLGISAADPLNLFGIVTPGEKISAITSNRIAYRDGLPVAVLEGGASRALVGDIDREVERALIRRRIPPALRRYLGRVG